ncbi:hypothetical protein BGX26_001793, partial [Mortierella sp. AD094]
MHSQKFRFRDETISLTAQEGPEGKFYTALVDIQEIFPEAARFKIHGAVLTFLRDDDGNRYEPKRIGYYPNDTIEVLTTVDHPSPGSNIRD